MGLLITFFLVSIIFSFLCSIWEAVLLSVTPSYVQVQLQEQTETGKLLNQFKENVDRPLAAILTLNTIAHTVGAIGVGAQATKIWGLDMMATIGVPVVMTLAILILSEIIPKTIGANFWKSLAPFTVKSIQIIIWILFPLVWLSQLITSKLKKDKLKSVLSRADFTAITRLAIRTGVFHPGESKIIENLMKFNSITARSIMTPRTVVLAADDDMTLQEFYDQYPTLRFSRIPIYRSSKDHIHGFFLKDDLLNALIQKRGNSKLIELKREILMIPEQEQILILFNTLIEKRTQIALVVDEFGGMSGLVTMEDVLETLLGLEIMDEFDSVDDMQAYARKKWEERARDLGILPPEN